MMKGTQQKQRLKAEKSARQKWVKERYIPYLQYVGKGERKNTGSSQILMQSEVIMLLGILYIHTLYIFIYTIYICI